MKRITWILIPSALILAGGLLSGCASTKDEVVQPAPQLMKVEEQKEDENVRQWREKAAMAIQAARAAVKQAASMDALKPETDQLMERAQRAYDNKDYENAVSYASQAKQQAEDSINQAYLQRARKLLDEINASKSLLSTEQETLLGAAEMAYSNREGKRAFDMASTLAAQLEVIKAEMKKKPASQPASYEVVRGDSLWKISGKAQIYGNSYQWPLIYKANRDKVKDADLIYPRQVLKINREATRGQIDAAVRHARTRGAWSLGVVEESDRDYLAR